ncbi:hypothetical protein JST97_04515 [bacterium]|nr:hypothetical protein [bacterium]
MRELDQLLEAQLDGCFSHSHGGFTLSLRDALGKLARHASYHPDHWALSLVQAFVALEARAIYLIHKGSDFWFVAQQCKPTDLLERNAQEVLGQDGQGLLARSLAALMEKQPVQLLLCEWDSPEKRPQVSLLAGEQKTPRLKPMLPPQGGSLGIFLQLRSNPPDLAQLLSYPLQYCPVPVHLLEHGWILNSDQDLRGKHWIDETPSTPLYPADLQTSVSKPLLMDRYEQGESSSILLKPPGGGDIAYFSDWIEQPEQLEWQSPPGLFDGTVSQGRYMRLGQGPLQNLNYQAGKTIGNTFMGERGTRPVCLPLHTGELIVMVEEQLRPDRILPVKHGAVLASINEQLRIPGAVVVADASHLVADISGLSLVRDQAFREWLQQLRVRVERALQEAVSNPPQAHGRLSLFSTMLGTGVATLGLACLDGVQGTDLLALTHGGVFGGTLVYGLAGAFRHYAPDSWFASHNARLLDQLKARHEAAIVARSQG